MQTNLKAVGRRYIPTSFIRSIQGMVNLTRPQEHECSLCGHVGRFFPFGNPPRRGAACGKCDSKERHRLMALWVAANLDTVNGARVLHFAPERYLEKLFRTPALEYRSADLTPGRADTVLNIEDINLPESSVDLVVCSHVLEHVDDAKALSEMYRILAPGGLALLMFPIVEGWAHTYEDPAHVSAADRTKYYGQFDHVRMFGRDVRDRIANAGFDLSEFIAEEPDVSRYGLGRGLKIFVAAKRL